MRTSSDHATTKRARAGHRRPAPLAAASVALLAVAAAGCGSGTSTSASSPASGTTAPPTTAPATTAPATTGSTTPPTTTGSTGTPAATRSASSRCTVTDLRIRLGRGDPGAGNVYYPLRFTNTSAHACVLEGFPGVSLIRGDGSTIGKPAAHQGAKGPAVRLAPGGTAQADLHTLNRGIKDGGCWSKPTLLKAYPPGSTDAMTLATATPVVCGDTFDVSTVH